MELPLRSGICGTTQRWMSLSGLLAVDPVGARLAKSGHLFPTNAHPFHEIVIAEQPMPSREGRDVPLDPLGESDLHGAVAAAGPPPT